MSEGALTHAPSPDLDLAWLAGIVEGEGSLGCGGGTRRNKPRVKITMTDYDVIESVQRITGLGRLTLVKTRDGHKQAYQWACYGDNARWLMGLLFPYLHTRRRRRIQEMMG